LFGLCPESLPKIWLANILVDVLFAYELANIGYKNELELVVGYWHIKKLAAPHPNTHQLFGHSK
jgi:hypothetical protein